MLLLPFAFVLGPLPIVALSVLFVVAAIAILRLPAFFAMMLAAMMAGLLTALNQTGDQRFAKAIETVMNELGSAMSRVGFTIALAAVIGMAMMESGAADKIIRRFIAVLGEGQAALALLACGFILAAPVFVDTVLKSPAGNFISISSIIKLLLSPSRPVRRPFAQRKGRRTGREGDDNGVQ